MKSIILMFELKQVHVLVDFLSSLTEGEKQALTIIALGADIEFALKEQGIPFQSGRGLRRLANFECLNHAETMAQEVFGDSTFSFFAYRGVLLARVFIAVLQDYLLSLLYFTDVIETLTETYPDCRRLILFAHIYIPLETDGVLAPLEANAAVEAARIVGKTRGFAVEVPTFETGTQMFRTRAGIVAFYGKRMVFGWVLYVLNTLVTAFVPPKRIRILASDNWKNIASLMPSLPDAELLLLDRAESRKAGLAAIVKNRIRFIHMQPFVSSVNRRRARIQADAFVTQWKRTSSNNVALGNAELQGHSLSEALSVALDLIVARGGRRAVDLIEGAYATYERMKPDVVLVRASYSAQIHFPILCYVARAVGIPSLEVQHGLIYIGTRSGTAQSAVQYMATYGPLTSTGYKKLGYTDDTLLNIGSPRFDVYQTVHDTATTGAKGKPFTIACTVPAVLPQSWADSYEVIEYLEGVAQAVARIPNVFVILKLRPDPHNEAFYRSVIAHIFSAVSHRIAQYEPIVDIFEESDAIITIYSTTVLEALISGRPVIYNGTIKMYNSIGKDLSDYAAAGALSMANTQQELTQTLESLAREPELRKSFVEKADLFMKQNYSFDGKASQKLADAIRVLALKKAETSAVDTVL